MTDDPFEQQVADLLRRSAAAQPQMPNLAGRITAAAERGPGRHRRPSRRRLRLWLPALAAAAVAAGVAIAVVSSGGGPASRLGQVEPGTVVTTPPASAPAPTTPGTSPTASSTPPATATPAATTPPATPTTPPASREAPTAAAPPPTTAEIGTAMQSTVDDLGLHFGARSTPVTVPDGSGGSLTAVIGEPTTYMDSHLQVLFFWHDSQFLGWDTTTEVESIFPPKAAGDAILATYGSYAAKDGACCPSLPEVTVTYRFTGGHLVPSESLPASVYGGGKRVHVHLT